MDLAKAQLRLEAVPLLQEEITASENALDKERSARAAAEQAAAVAQAQLAAEQRARERVESELEAVLAREVRMADQVNDLTSRMADGRLVRVRPERDVRRPLRKATSGKSLIDARRGCMRGVCMAIVARPHLWRLYRDSKTGKTWSGLPTSAWWIAGMNRNRFLIDS